MRPVSEPGIQDVNEESPCPISRKIQQHQRQSQPTNLLSDETDVSKQLDEIADEMAGEAGKTENRYDEGHNIFTK